MSLKDSIVDWLFPPRCAVCMSVVEKRSAFCDICLPEIAFVEDKTCEVCGIPLSFEFPSRICGRCRNSDFRFVKNISLFEHKGAARSAVLNMKYNSRAAISDIADLIAMRIANANIAADAVTFVPMTKTEEHKKGFNVPYLLAMCIAKRLKLPLFEYLVKVRPTQKQKELTVNQRIINVRGAYAVKGDVAGRRILIIDDVFTTGATLNECAKILDRTGSCAVYTATASIRDRE